MSNWQLTATTVFCDTTGGEVTIIVYKNGQSKCTGVAAASKTKKATALSCSAENCKQVSAYKAKLDADENHG